MIYSFVTAYARLSMLKDIRWIQLRGGRIFYMDTGEPKQKIPARRAESKGRKATPTPTSAPRSFTDSLIFDIDDSKKSAVDAHLNVGCRAYGSYKYEVDRPLESYVALGPKNYSVAYRNDAHDLLSIVRVRGFSLKSREAIEKMNHDSMKKMLRNWVVHGIKESVTTKQFQMRIDRHKQTVTNRYTKKVYKNHLDSKRKRVEDPDANLEFTTHPFGCKHDRFSDVPASEK